MKAFEGFLKEGNECSVVKHIGKAGIKEVLLYFQMLTKLRNLGPVGLCFSKALYYVMFEIEFTQCERCTFRGLHFFLLSRKKLHKSR